MEEIRVSWGIQQVLASNAALTVSIQGSTSTFPDKNQNGKRKEKTYKFQPQKRCEGIMYNVCASIEKIDINIKDI